MNHFISALQFLTILKIKEDIEEKYLPSSLIFFPLVGFIIGLFSSIFNKCFSCFLNPLISDILTVLFIIFLTGGIHIDGVADTFDGIFGGKNKEEILKIMRDKNTGTFGTISIIFVILLKIFLINLLPGNIKFNGIIVTPLFGRFMMVFSIYFFNYARETGKGKIFFEGINTKIFILSTFLFTILVSFFFSYILILFLLPLIIFTFFLNKYLTKKIGGLTGDTLGAINELNEILLLFLISNGKIKSWW
jgi:adenosylcobinamide-GDP ribazoletransferase